MLGALVVILAFVGMELFFLFVGDWIYYWLGKPAHVWLMLGGVGVIGAVMCFFSSTFATNADSQTTWAFLGGLLTICSAIYFVKAKYFPRE